MDVRETSLHVSLLRLVAVLEIVVAPLEITCTMLVARHAGYFASETSISKSVISLAQRDNCNINAGNFVRYCFVLLRNNVGNKETRLPY